MAYSADSTLAPTPEAESRTLALIDSEKEILARIAAGAPLHEVLETLVRAVERRSDGDLLASILLLDENRRHLLHGAAPSLPADYNAAIHGLEIGPKAGSCGTAAYRRQPVYVADIASDPLWADFRDLALAHGLRACWSTPILGDDGQVLGTFAIYYREPRSPTKQHLETISFVARTAAIAIERHRSAEALREGRERLVAALEASRTGTFRWDIRTNELEWDEALDRLFGLPPGETAPSLERFLALVHPDDRAAVVARCERCAADGADFDMEFRVVWPDGSVRWLYDRGKTFRDAQGRPAYMAGACVDVTERKRSEQRLQEQNEQYRSIFEATSDAILIFDLGGRIVQANPAACRIHAASHDELVGRRGSELVAPEDRHKFAEFLETVTAGRPFRAQGTHLRRDGGRIVVDVTGTRLVYAGAPHLLAVVRDLTEQRRAEAALRESEAFLRLVLDSAADGFYGVDRDGRTTLCNAAFLHMLGFRRTEDVIGRKLHDVIHHSHPDGSPYPEEECHVYRTAQTGEPVHVDDEVFFRADGTSFPVEYSVHPILRGGELQGAVCTFTDITERKRAEEQQRLLLRELNHRVKNLFAMASGMVALSARSAGTPEEMAKTLRGRLDALARAHELIRPSLTGHGEQTRIAALDTLVREILSPYADAQGREARARVTIAGPAVSVSGNAVTSLSLTLHELATNAAKYGALSGPDGHVRIGWTLEDGELRLVWQERGGPPLVEPPEGKGFGSLLIDRSVVGQLGGKISFDWEPEGLTVHLSAPVERLTG